MLQYQFRCDGCGNYYTVNNNTHPQPCPTCGMRVTRVWAFTTGKGMPEHFNNAVGEFVSSKQQFYDGLKRKSEESYVRTGLEADYQPVDPSDMRDPSAHGVTEDGLEATYRAHHDAKGL